MSSESNTGFIKGVFATVATIAALIAIYEFVIKNQTTLQPTNQTPVTQVVPITQIVQVTQILPVTPVPPVVTQKEVYANRDWQDTGIEVGKSDNVTIQYVSGKWSPFPGYYTDGQGCTDPRVCTQDLTVLANWPDNIVGGIHATLIARVGNGQIVVVGNDATFRSNESGRLQLRMNDRVISDNSGSITVLVKVR